MAAWNIRQAGSPARPAWTPAGKAITVFPIRSRCSMAEDQPSSTLKRPPAKLLERYHHGQIGDDTIRKYLTNGYSLAICCRECDRAVVEWRPPELARRFGSKPDLRIATLAQKLYCAGDEGCGSHDIAVFPHLYDHPWTWNPDES